MRMRRKLWKDAKNKCITKRPMNNNLKKMGIPYTYNNYDAWKETI